MKKIICLLSLIFIIFACSKPTVLLANTEASKEMTLANNFIQQLEKQEYSKARAYFDEAMLKAMSEKNLKKTWETLNSQVGPFQEILKHKVDSLDGYVRVRLISQFEHALIDVIVVVNKEQKMSGLFFRPSDYKPEEKTAKKITEQTETDHLFEELISFGDTDWQLPGTVTYPKNHSSAPLLILVHGSGPNDRDESIGPNKPFKDIAHGLAEHGIATLRYDKRTKVHGQKISQNIAELTTYEETTDDAVHAISFAKTLNNIDQNKIFVAGHSLGGMLIPRISESTKDAAGFIMLAAPARPMEELLLEQYNYIFMLDEKLSEDETDALDNLAVQIKTAKNLTTDKNVSAKDLPLGMHQNYWLDLNNYNIIETAKEIKKPLFIAQGGRDYQVLADKDFAIWKQKMQMPNVSLKLYPDLNHLMISGQGKSTPEEYSLAGNVSKELMNDIAVWIKQL